MQDKLRPSTYHLNFPCTTNFFYILPYPSTEIYFFIESLYIVRSRHGIQSKRTPHAREKPPKPFTEGFEPSVRISARQLSRLAP